MKKEELKGDDIRFSSHCGVHSFTLQYEHILTAA